MKQTVTLLLLMLATATLSLAAQTYEQLTTQAADAIGQDSLHRAEQLILRALQTDPANPRNSMLFSNLGLIRQRQGRYEQALESYTFALNIAPLSVPILMNRASLLMQLGRSDHARADYSLVLDREPENIEALLMRAYIHTAARRYKEARADYVSLLKIAPTDYNARLGLAMLEQKEARYDEAILLLNTLIAEHDGDTAAPTAESSTPTPESTASLALLYTARAGIRLDMNQPDTALLDLDEAIRLAPSQPDAYIVRGQIYLSRQQKKKARLDFDKAIALGVPQSELHDLLLRCR